MVKAVESFCSELTKLEVEAGLLDDGSTQPNLTYLAKISSRGHFPDYSYFSGMQCLTTLSAECGTIFM